MDAMLRKVLAQREREQEEAILLAPPEAFMPPECEGCGRRMHAVDDGKLHRFCTACGGMKRQMKESRT